MPCENGTLMAGAYEYLVGFTVFNTVGTGDPRSAGSIPVRLRHSPFMARKPIVTCSAGEPHLVKAFSERNGVLSRNPQMFAQLRDREPV